MTFRQPDTGLDAPGRLYIRHPMMILPTTRTRSAIRPRPAQQRSERRVDIRPLETGGADCAVAYVSDHNRQDARFRGRNAYVAHHSRQDERSRDLNRTVPITAVKTSTRVRPTSEAPPLQESFSQRSDHEPGLELGGEER